MGEARRGERLGRGSRRAPRAPTGSLDRDRRSGWCRTPRGGRRRRASSAWGWTRGRWASVAPSRGGRSRRSAPRTPTRWGLVGAPTRRASPGWRDIPSRASQTCVRVARGTKCARGEGSNQRRSTEEARSARRFSSRRDDEVNIAVSVHVRANAPPATPKERAAARSTTGGRVRRARCSTAARMAASASRATARSSDTSLWTRANLIPMPGPRIS